MEVKAGFKGILSFSNVLGIAAGIAVEKVHNIGGFTGESVFDVESFFSSATDDNVRFY